MLETPSRCFDSERELSQHILLQAILSLENITHTSSALTRDEKSAPLAVGPARRDVEKIVKDTKGVIQSLAILHEVLFRKDLSTLEKSRKGNYLSEGLGERTAYITPPPGYSLPFTHDMDENQLNVGDVEVIQKDDVEYIARIGNQWSANGKLEAIVSSLPTVQTKETCQAIAPHATSQLWFDLPELIRRARDFLQIHYETIPGGIPLRVVQQVASWEVIFSISRSSSTDSIWNIEHQEQRFEVFEPRDLGLCYRLKCICPKGALHSLDVYCPRNISSELSGLGELERDSKEYNRKKSKKMSSPEQSEDEDDDEEEEGGDGDGDGEATGETEEPEPDYEAIAAREAAEAKQALLELKEKEIAGIMEMVGWQSAKEHIQKLEAKVRTSARQGVDLQGEGFGTILMGGSGTGKTTFAHQYAAYLYAAGLVGTSTVKSTNGIYLADGGIARIKNYIENLQDDGGILFVDDAHFLLSSDHSGVKVLDYLLQSIPLHQTKITFILSGTEKGMQNIIGHGSRGIGSMFPYLLSFKDFSDGEMVSLFQGVVKRKWEGKMEVEGGDAGIFVRVAAKRLGRGTGTERFGNARAVEGFVGQVWERQVVRRGVERETEEEAKKAKEEAGKFLDAARKPVDDTESKDSQPDEMAEKPSVPEAAQKDVLMEETGATVSPSIESGTMEAETEATRAGDEVPLEEKRRGCSVSEPKTVTSDAEPDDINPVIDESPISTELEKPGEANAEPKESVEFLEEQPEKSKDTTKDADPQVDPKDYKFTKEDILGPDPSKAVLNSLAWTKLQKLTGLEKVKDSILSLLELVKANYQREMEEKPLLKVSLNRLFLGPPGTGKTLVAKLYGQLLAEIGILSKGEVLLRNPSDLLGTYIGDSEANTKAALNAAIGNVLVIDEAYMMYTGGSDGTGNESDSYRQGIMDTLVGEIQSEPGEDRCVLLLGYDSAMEEMLQNSNPGLSRRFPLADAFRFQNFTIQELESILRSKLAEQVLEASEEAIKVAMDVLSKASQRANFGNGGEVENLITKAKTNYQSRISHIPIPDRPKEWGFLPQDFDPDFERGKSATSNLKKLFTDVVGCEAVIHKLETYQRVALAMKTRDLDPRPYIPTNFIFKGPPGTGKTTTARKLARVYYDMGLLSEPAVVECSASDLIGKYVGHSGPKTAKVFEKALGRVMFIDEAYRLADGGKCSYASEVVSELVDLLTKPKFAGKLVVVLAGYEEEMNGLLGMNPGLASRFPEEICFGDLSREACVEILWLKVRGAGIEVADCASFSVGKGGGAEVLRIMGQLIKTKGWGNARDVETLAKGVCREVFSRLGDGEDLVCTKDIVMSVLWGMLVERRKRGGEHVDEEVTWGNGEVREGGGVVMKDKRNGIKKMERIKERLPGEVKNPDALEAFLAGIKK
ncbi:P-loop containing nucleoside triphosphate hydrolase protein [Leptodontidium sp. MPI-SDFR-AT-0119]|nr:P-loop containing nucleoside triphosphate hydrolase protein [Leptodontidium sp. MPI-SDFR-AT-0119]